ncbi:hypothetical protein SAMN05192549_110169 [Duganella sacchari]|uniref:Uncharacterized protein n=1 Tax=Duganella sacchari TaxID=551987 RepID=A0A1M7R4W3_9BURK|nr:hypothetical protein [Duganella sacchari]SHN40214.1 hypothetical protein SAMN05192549_110169 [Duganella sacchari]
MGIFSRRRKPAADTGGLGETLIALRLDSGDLAPSGSTLVIFNAAGHARRLAAGKVACDQGETVFCFDPGPYTVDLIPFASAPEWGLRMRFVVDAANPRVSQQRFDLFLYSETAGRLALADFASSAELALQAELAQGALDLPPCTSVEEWHAFRAGLNQLMYMRYGVTVDDCVPVDLGEQIDYATTLQARARQAAATIVLPSVPVAELRQRELRTPQASTSQQASTAQQDARALRRLFLELPPLSSELRLLTLPDGAFPQHQALLLRLRMAALNVNTMPALAWAAPDQPLPTEDQARRSVQALVAQDALDEAWALLARLQLAGQEQWPALLDDADRICANMETGLSLRRLAQPPRTEPSL